jgi:hypothetical protein
VGLIADLARGAAAQQFGQLIHPDRGLGQEGADQPPDQCAFRPARFRAGDVRQPGPDLALPAVRVHALILL